MPRWPEGDEKTGNLPWETLGKRIHDAALRDRRPVAGTLALTYRCNLGCVHCYLDGSREKRELATERWCEIVDEVQEAGCLWLHLTGGEPLLRDDFPSIYLHAKRAGLLVMVSTNGTLLGDDIVDLFREYPPHVVEISLYGHRPEVYGSVTGAAGLRDACHDAARRLAEARVPLRLKSVVLRENASDVVEMERFAEGLGVQFRVDGMIQPTLGGSMEPRRHALEDERVVGLDVGDERRLRAWGGLLSRGIRPRRDSLFNCGAGQLSFFVDPAGLVSLCAFERPVFDLADGSFRDAWDGAIRERSESPLPEGHACAGCSEQVFCEVCPPVARMETGDDLGRPGSRCRFGLDRSRAIRRELEARESRSGGAAR